MNKLEQWILQNHFTSIQRCNTCRHCQRISNGNLVCQFIEAIVIQMLGEGFHVSILNQKFVSSDNKCRQWEEQIDV